MNDELKIKEQVSNCFNAKHVTYSLSGGVESAYQKLADLLTEGYDLTHSQAEDVIDDIEALVAQYVMEESPKFTDVHEFDHLEEWDRKYEEKVGK